LRHWWRRTDEARRRQPQQRASRLGREIALVLTPHFGREFEGSVTWCRRRGGAPLTRWERWLIRRSFVFRNVTGLSRDLPMPANFIEELADKVIGQIDRLAITGFKSALDELVRYHKFLLEVYASRSAEGAPLSLAEIGGLWEQPHQEWTRQYRRIFERPPDTSRRKPSSPRRWHIFPTVCFRTMGANIPRPWSSLFSTWACCRLFSSKPG
jgi:hypothetical protein